MPRNGSGTYTLPQSPFVAGSTISSTAVNSDFSDIATALTGSLAADGQTPITAPLKFTSGTASAPGITFTGETTSGIFLAAAGKVGVAAAGTAIAYFDNNKAGTGQNGSLFYYGNGAIPSPVGAVSDFAGSTAPSGWFLCYGQAVSRTAYPELFTVIGTTYGSGDGSTTYNLPDARGRASFGRDDMGGSAAGRITAAVSGITGTSLGAAGGAQSVTVVRSDLPNVGLGVGSLAVTITPQVSGAPAYAFPNSATSFAAGGGPTLVPKFNEMAGLTLLNSGITGNTESLNGAVGQTSLNKMPPAIIFNKIIFAGRV